MNILQCDRYGVVGAVLTLLPRNSVQRMQELTYFALHIVKTLLQFVGDSMEQASSRLSDVVVLTDDQRILEVVQSAGHNAAMTSERCA